MRIVLQHPPREVPAEQLLIERAFRRTLSPPEMTVLLGGLRVLMLRYEGRRPMDRQPR